MTTRCGVVATTAWLAVAAPAVAQRIAVGVPAVFASRVAEVIDGIAGDDAVVVATGTMAASLSGEAVHVLLLQDEWTLARLAAADRLAPLDGEALSFVVPFTVPVVLACADSGFVVGGADIAWDELALRPELHDRLGLAAPEVDGGPWLCAFREALRRGGSEDHGIAIWTTLDARAGRLVTSVDEVLEGLRGGSFAAAVGPANWFTGPSAQGRASLRTIPVRCGVQAAYGSGLLAGAPPAARGVFRRLDADTARRSLAAAAGFAVADGAAGAIDPGNAVAWWRRFDAEVRGRGRSVERIADWLDAVFAVLFLVVAFVAWRTLRRAPAERG
ncbi:MAG: hypothetical protein JNK78_09450 [Planctomycetes bacterium]|nr:hypothetical protein [Planctomycetota bacterium]